MNGSYPLSLISGDKNSCEFIKHFTLRLKEILTQRVWIVMIMLKWWNQWVDKYYIRADIVTLQRFIHSIPLVLAVTICVPTLRTSKVFSFIDAILFIRKNQKVKEGLEYFLVGRRWRRRFGVYYHKQFAWKSPSRDNSSEN